MSVTTRLEGGNGKITIPIVQGMGFITAIYENVNPVFASQVGVRSLTKLEMLSVTFKNTPPSCLIK